MKLSFSSSSLAIAVVLVAVPAAAQETSVIGQAGGTATAPQDGDPGTGPEPDIAEDDVNTIIVLGARLVGQVDAPEPPILELDAEDIAAYGAGSIAELLEALGPQVSSGRGRGGDGGPVILVNGVRISSFRELRSYPPEAIERTEVFSESVAQQYGYSPDQRVVNFILKDNFASREIEVEYGQPFAGGYSQQEIEGTYLRIDGPSRLNLNVEWNNSSMLTEAERGINQSDGSVPDLASDPDPALYRSLVADSAGVEATANWTTRLGQAGNSLSANATYEREDSLRLQGLDTVLLTDDSDNSLLRSFNADDPLTVDIRSETYALGSTINLQLGEWEVTGTLDGTYVDSISRTARSVDTSALVADVAAGLFAIDGDIGSFSDAGTDEALTDTYTVNALTTARARPIFLPAGDVSVTLDAGYSWNRLESSDTSSLAAPTQLTRGTVFGGANVAIPITSRDEEFLGALGDITLNLNAGVDHLSDFGTLTDWNVGATWGVTDTLTFTANHINREVAPTLSQLGSPAIATPNVPVFDIVNNETVLATVITGGNAALPAQQQSDWKLGLIWELPFIERGTFSVDYFDNHSENVTASLPVLSPAIETAFPDRIVRDANGQLVQVDERYITLAERDQRRLQFGLNLSGQIGGSESGSGGGRGGAAGRGGPASIAGSGGGDTGQANGEGRRGPPDAARLEAMRTMFCNNDPDALQDLFNRAIAAQAAGEEAPLDADGNPIAIPPRMLQRLAGEDGQVDPERFAALRDRVCSGEGPTERGQAGRGQDDGEGPPSRGGDGPPPQADAGGPPPGAGGGAGAGAGRGGGGGRGMGRLGRFMGGSDGPPSGRWFVNLNYTLELENTALIAEGVELLDLLDGDALTSSGDPRHTANARAGVFYDGFGLRADATYSGSSWLEGGTAADSTDLYFGDLFTLDLRAFADLGRQEKLVGQMPFLENTRVSFSVDNVFNTRREVTDSTGETPLRYQPLLLDPVGRSFEIEFRKLF